MSKTPTTAPRAYRSIFLADGWAHQKYFGWSVAEDFPGLRVLRKRRAVFERSLILLGRDGREALDGTVARAAGWGGLSDIVIHDMDGLFETAPVIAGCAFRRAEQRERLLNIATMVIDLTSDEASILAGMSSDYRRKIKKAEASGVKVEAHAHPASPLVDDFAAAFKAFAGERGLNPADPKALGRMYDAGDAELLVASKNGVITNYLHLYKAGDTAIFMYGVNLSKENDGAGQYLHWQAVRHLKSQGVGWYDLGGVASLDPTDGIHNFKAKFGARLVELGSESIHSGAGVRLAQSLRAHRR